MICCAKKSCFDFLAFLSLLAVLLAVLLAEMLTKQLTETKTRNRACIGFLAWKEAPKNRIKIFSQPRRPDLIICCGSILISCIAQNKSYCHLSVGSIPASEVVIIVDYYSFKVINKKDDQVNDDVDGQYVLSMVIHYSPKEEGGARAWMNEWMKFVRTYMTIIFPRRQRFVLNGQNKLWYIC